MKMVKDRFKPQNSAIGFVDLAQSSHDGGYLPLVQTLALNIRNRLYYHIHWFAR